MITNLPKTFAELTIVETSNGMEVETTNHFLIKAIDPQYVTVIDSNGDMCTYPTTAEPHELGLYPLVKSIRFISSDSDEYEDFTIGVYRCETSKSIDKLANMVYSEFKAIMDVCPINRDTLFKTLLERVEHCSH